MASGGYSYITVSQLCYNSQSMLRPPPLKLPAVLLVARQAPCVDEGGGLADDGVRTPVVLVEPPVRAGGARVDLVLDAGAVRRHRDVHLALRVH